MDLTGYGYRRSPLRQQVPQITTSRALEPVPRSAELTGEALRFLVKLDRKVRLDELATRFPRVLNRIAQVWDNPQQAARYFDDLLLYSRGVRQGFPHAVVSEIASLHQYHLERTFPKRVDPWEQTMLR